MKKIDVDGYLSDKGKRVRKQIDSLSSEQLALWADKLYSDGFETPGEHIERCAQEFKDDVSPF